MELVENRCFDGENVVLDDKEFRGCTLTGCVLEYSGRPLILSETVLQGCQYVFFGPARATVHFLQGIGLMEHNPLQWAELSSRTH